MSTKGVKVRLLHPNLDHDRGETVEMDVELAAAWCSRGLAEPINEKSDPRRIMRQAVRPKIAPRLSPERKNVPTLKPINLDT